MNQLKQTIAFLFRRKGKEVLSEKEFSLSLSMDMHWFSPKESAKLIEKALSSKLLVKTEKGLKPNFDYGNLEIPIGFKPSKDILEYKEDMFLSILNEISEKTGMDKKGIIAEINRRQDELNIEIESVALLLARKYNIDMSKFFDDVEKIIIERHRPQHS
ncbi:MAG: DUF2240 family protein [Candidatus Thermoplasmatota archaeon]|nr:DUF2240 family protein [Candidatus Thermoplasmatota archaeon]MCG2825397.1 DUF2240 family protein [Thermoplasmatales archaeon]